MESQDLSVRLRVPIAAEPIVCVAGLQFRGWLPGPSELIEVEDGQAKITISVANSHLRDDASGNEPVHELDIRLRATVSADDVRTLSDASAADARQSSSEPLSKALDALSDWVYRLVVRSVNTLINYARFAKGQYWLETYPASCANPSACLNKWMAEFRAGQDGEWLAWPRSSVIHLTGVWHAGSSRPLSRADWTQAAMYVRGDVEVPFPMVLLAEAERLASRGESRTALTEAVAALEAALTLFVQTPAAEELFRGSLAGRIPAKRLARAVGHLGFRATLAFLLPVLIDESRLPTEVVLACLEAVDARGSVVHQSQRSVPFEKLRLYLVNVRRMAELLSGVEGGVAGDDGFPEAPD